MVCATAILTSSLALSILRHSSSPDQSFVYSPFSLNTVLSIVHDGASGETQNEIVVPKFKQESELNAKKMSSLFNDELANLSKISPIPLFISKIKHKAVIEVNEQGTEAAAATEEDHGMQISDDGDESPSHPIIFIDRPFLFGILRNDDIFFLGQSVR
ncbi:hypothetical protein PRIPAC_71824 [Pristionchus pacificus]|uniref:Uncharacterized protein n=1 Tax=Pristionchus pacificus TaxID=54126 RepID=A0A2A6CR51_PRIPA|nr:hypothetical protein PRIPAC_71824 [Pristionchus pacificus]|eukprot:PDM80576.1 hypothetical protein PRIPAC_35579 [Pristionchus pacificus]